MSLAGLLLGWLKAAAQAAASATPQVILNTVRTTLPPALCS